MKITLGGDVFRPPGAVATLSSNLFADSDHSILNLEGPATRFRTPRTKTGPNIRMGPETLEVLAEAGVTVFALANNHILDFGISGLEETIAAIRGLGLRAVGASGDPDVARRPLLLGDSDLPVAVFNRAEHEWNTFGAVGANVIPMTSLARQLNASAQSGNTNVVILHGGIEHYPLPTPRQLNELRFLAESGAHAIVMHHTHCFSGMETWERTPIYYGLGNLQFAMSHSSPEWYRGLLVDLTVHEPGVVTVQHRFVGMNPETYDVDHLRGANLERAEIAFDHRSRILDDPGVFEKHWASLIQQESPRYIQAITPAPGLSRWSMAARRVIARGLVSRWDGSLAMWLNTMRCSSHRELLQAVLEDSLAGWDSPGSKRHRLEAGDLSDG